MIGQHVKHARIILNVVVLPAPFGPKRARIVFCETPNVTSSTAFACEPRNVLEICITRNGSLELETASVSASTSVSIIGVSVLSAAALCFLRLERIFAGKFDPESNQTRTAKRIKGNINRYVIGPPYFVMLPNEFVVICSPPSHRSENKLTETNDARS